VGDGHYLFDVHKGLDQRTKGLLYKYKDYPLIIYKIIANYRENNEAKFQYMTLKVKVIYE
jgi:hypothetical protein